MARQLIVSWSWSNQLLVSSNFRPFARTKAKAGRLVLEHFASVGVSARSWHVELIEFGLQLEAHGESRVLIFDRRGILLVSTSSWSLQTRKALQLFAHEDTTLTKGALID